MITVSFSCVVFFADIRNAYVCFKKDGEVISPSHKMQTLQDICLMSFFLKGCIFENYLSQDRDMTDQTLDQYYLTLMQFPSVVDLNMFFRSSQYTYLCLIKLNVSAVSLGYLAASQHSSNFIVQTLKSCAFRDAGDIVWSV